ncbi:MAG: hypothetical protein HY209_07750, partial [Candidatus Omnitrophica bacterium]|nr:hypothetical protein [Candidatus Omnitrophota bacterium]
DVLFAVSLVGVVGLLAALALKGSLIVTWLIHLFLAHPAGASIMAAMPLVAMAGMDAERFFNEGYWIDFKTEESATLVTVHHVDRSKFRDNQTMGGFVMDKLDRHTIGLGYLRPHLPRGGYGYGRTFIALALLMLYGTAKQPKKFRHLITQPGVAKSLSQLTGFSVVSKPFFITTYAGEVKAKVELEGSVPQVDRALVDSWRRRNNENRRKAMEGLQQAAGSSARVWRSRSGLLWMIPASFIMGCEARAQEMFYGRLSDSHVPAILHGDYVDVFPPFMRREDNDTAIQQILKLNETQRIQVITILSQWVKNRHIHKDIAAQSVELLGRLAAASDELVPLILPAMMEALNHPSVKVREAAQIPYRTGIFIQPRHYARLYEAFQERLYDPAMRRDVLLVLPGERVTINDIESMIITQYETAITFLPRTEKEFGRVIQKPGDFVLSRVNGEITLALFDRTGVLERAVGPQAVSQILIAKGVIGADGLVVFTRGNANSVTGLIPYLYTWHTHPPDAPKASDPSQAPGDLATATVQAINPFSPQAQKETIVRPMKYRAPSGAEGGSAPASAQLPLTPAVAPVAPASSTESAVRPHRKFNIQFTSVEAAIKSALENIVQDEAAIRVRKGFELLQHYYPSHAEILSNYLGINQPQGDWSCQAIATQLKITRAEVTIRKDHALAMMQKPEIFAMLEAMRAIPQRVRMRFEAMGLSVRDLAKAQNQMTIHGFTIMIRNVLEGDAGYRRIKIVDVLANVLKTNVTWLVFGQGAPDPVSREENGETFAARLQRLREHEGLSKAKLGKVIGKMSNSIKTFESGNKKPNLMSLIFLSWALDRPVGYLVAGEITPASPLHTWALPEVPVPARPLTVISQEKSQAPAASTVEKTPPPPVQAGDKTLAQLVRELLDLTYQPEFIRGVNTSSLNVLTRQLLGLQGVLDATEVRCAVEKIKGHPVFKNEEAQALINQILSARPVSAAPGVAQPPVQTKLAPYKPQSGSKGPAPVKLAPAKAATVSATAQKPPVDIAAPSVDVLSALFLAATKDRRQAQALFGATSAEVSQANFSPELLHLSPRKLAAQNPTAAFYMARYFIIKEGDVGQADLYLAAIPDKAITADSEIIQRWIKDIKALRNDRQETAVYILTEVENPSLWLSFLSSEMAEKLGNYLEEKEYTDDRITEILFILEAKRKTAEAQEESIDERKKEVAAGQGQEGMDANEVEEEEKPLPRRVQEGEAEDSDFKAARVMLKVYINKQAGRLAKEWNVSANELEAIARSMLKELLVKEWLLPKADRKIGRVARQINEIMQELAQRRKGQSGVAPSVGTAAGSEENLQEEINKFIKEQLPSETFEIEEDGSRKIIITAEEFAQAMGKPKEMAREISTAFGESVTITWPRSGDKVKFTWLMKDRFPSDEKGGAQASGAVVF